MTHHCHARGCKKSCPPERLMCLAHWRKVPKDLQRAIWATYRPGQCDDRRPSDAWFAAADAAIAAVANAERPIQPVQVNARIPGTNAASEPVEILL